MSDNWLNKRMKPSHKKNEHWLELSNAAWKLFEDHLEGLLQRMKNMRSYFFAEDADLKRLLLDHGLSEERTIFSSGSMGTVTAVNLQNVKFKDTSWLVERILKAEYRLSFVRWQALYAPTDTTTYPYGDVFLTAQEVADHPTFDASNTFMTSRGVLEINLLEALASGFDLEGFKTAIRPRMQALLPIRIVYDGILYRFEMELSQSPYAIELSGETIPQDDVDLGESSEWSVGLSEVGYRFDDTPADDVPLDSGY